MKFTLLMIVMLIASSFVYSQKTNEDALNKKVNELLAKMTLEEKIGQMTQVDLDAIKKTPKDIAKYAIGSLLCGGDTEVPDITAKGWADTYEKYQNIALKSRLAIPILWGIDAVHGHNNVDGATIFPHNIGLGATRNPQLVEKIAAITAKEIKGTGIQWDFAPCVAVALNERWGRTYESFGEDPELVKNLGVAYVKGMQTKDLSNKNAVLASVKHFIGDGGTTNGIDQGNTEIDEAALRKIHLPGYIETIKAGAKNIMITFNSWNGEKVHGHKYLITDLLKGELGFKGFVVSDWAGIDQLDKDYKTAIEKSINAGMDMAMIPFGPDRANNYLQFITYLIELVNEGKVSMNRIDDAVQRILKVKFEMNLWENYKVDRKLTKEVGSAEHREVARDAVRQSLVLLKNDNNILPLSKQLKRIHVTGKSADDIGNQCGGWTIIWQSKSGNVISGGTTVLQAVKNTVSKGTKVTSSLDGTGAEGADVCLVVVGETPYAEMFGDREDLSLAKEDVEAIEKASASGVPVVVLLISGRPMIVENELRKSNAFIAAWLPGTEGQGIADVLFGDFKPTGKLPHSWPKNMKQIPINIGDANYDPLFPFGFGLTY
ncbi:MAG: glycoside hydrolase family protein [Ignavibacteria bacterium]|nr:MAG: glycoside hydrolase family protein [Ignavibacteria bacterium]KAF0156684.1 MAG: glycoside hydrolase family protein [Ignavibacteria bacterium]